MKFTDVAAPPRVLLMGEPASGKTGSIAQLANAGYRILLHDFDTNSRVIGSYLKAGHADIFVQQYESARLSADGLLAKDPAIIDRAVEQMNNFYRQLKHWKTDSEDLGPSSKLGPRDIVVIDSSTFMSDMLLTAANKHPEVNKNMQTLYRVAGSWLKNILYELTSTQMGASVLVLSHIGQSGQRDAQGNLIGEVREIPTGVGEKASKQMTSYFTDIWHLKVSGPGTRTILTAATPKMALRTSRPDLIKAQEPFDLASMWDRLLAPRQVA